MPLPSGLTPPEPAVIISSMVKRRKPSKRRGLVFLFFSSEHGCRQSTMAHTHQGHSAGHCHSRWRDQGDLVVVDLLFPSGLRERTSHHQPSTPSGSPRSSSWLSAIWSLVTGKGETISVHHRSLYLFFLSLDFWWQGRGSCIQHYCHLGYWSFGPLMPSQIASSSHKMVEGGGHNCEDSQTQRNLPLAPLPSTLDARSHA